MVATIKFSQFANADLNNSGNTLVGISSPLGGVNVKSPFTNIWTTVGRPATPYPGVMGYNSTDNVPEYWDGIAWIQLTSGGGNITQINTGTGLTGGPITTTGIISFASIAAKSLWANTTNASAVPTVTPLTDFLLSANNLSEITNADTARANLFLASGRGTAGQVLTSNGAAVPPTWEANTGAGVVGPGLINEIAWYDATGNAVNGLPTEVNGVLVTNASGVPSISTGGQIPGTTTNNVAAAGNIGEELSSPYASGIVFNNNTPTNINTLVLMPGDWDVWAHVDFTRSLGSSTSTTFVCVSDTPLSFPPANSSSKSSLLVTGVNSSSSFTSNISTGTQIMRVPDLTTLTVYLVLQVNNATPETFTAGGLIIARRRR